MPTTVFKKQSPNGQITLYLSSREFVYDHGKVTPIDGVVYIDPLYLKDRKVYAIVVLVFRYGREDEEVMGLKFYTEAVLDFKQVYPCETPSEEDLSVLQSNLIRKLGKDAYPLTLRISSHAPPSVRLQPARPYNGSPLGVTYDLKVFVGERPEEKPHKRSSVRITLRCMQYVAPETLLSTASPCASVSKTFIFSPGRLEIEVLLDREIYHHDDVMHIHVTVNNNSNKTVHKVKVYALQHVNVCMFTNGRFKNLIGSTETEDKHPIPPGASISRDFGIKPMSCLKYPVALALEGSFHEESKFLASSTLLVDPKDKNPYGVVVSYEVKVKAILGCMDKPITVHLPFKLLHPVPAEGSMEQCDGTCKMTRSFTTDLLESEDSVCGDVAQLVMISA
ncbi:arrestin homolog [Centruroides vittatus]|uniref:arrestin homolog n=1 Tax=Centruroides vittatus TaxID=120091 RepID=UPI003510C6D9